MPSPNLSVCFVTSTYPRDAADVAVPWLRQHVKSLAEAGCEVTVFAPAYKGSSSHEVDGIPVLRFRYFFAGLEDLTHDSGAPTRVSSPMYVVISAFYIIAGRISLGWLLRRKKFDVIHVHWPFPHALFTRYLTGSKPAVVLNFHGAELLLVQKFKFVGPILAAASRRSQGIIANSSFTKRKVQQLVDADVSVIPYGNPIAVPAEDIETMVDSSRPCQILFVGRLIERKGVEYLIEAMKAVNQATGAHLTIVGQGILGESLRTQVANRDAGSYIQFKENLSEQELANEYTRADVFCLPAIVDRRGDTEGLGVVLIEAICFGCAVVASNLGGIPDVIRDGQTGVLVAEKNPTELAEALCKLAMDPDLRDRLARQGLEHVRAEFSWPAVVEKTLTVYRQALTAKR